MKKIICIILFAFAGFNTFAQGIARDWYGVLSIPGGSSLHLVFHIAKTADTYTSTMDSPDQGAKGLATDNTTLTGNQLTINASKYGIVYTGTYMADSNKIAGTFKQGAGSIPLTLYPAQSPAALTPAARPQDPKDFPYKQEEVAFTNPVAGDTLAGTLTMPSDGKASKIVVLITGSGPQNRNEELLGHRPFLVWSDWLTRHGIAVLRYDDRGIGKSTGTFSSATSADFADDAEAAVNYIKSRADLKNLAIGLMGHSEGGMIAPIVASRNKDVKFIVLLAGPGVPIVDLMVKQSADQMRLAGAPEDAITRSSAITTKLYTLVAQSQGMPAEDLKIKVDTLLSQQYRALPKADLAGKSIPEMVNSLDRPLLTSWCRYFIAFNPQDYLMKVKCPVLALDGTKDMQVNAEANLAGIKQALQKGGNKHFEVVPLTGLNHLFQAAKTGSVAEYSQIEETVDPVALDKVAGWIEKL